MTPTERVRSVLDAMERHPRVAWVTRAQSGQLRAGRYWVHLCKAGTPDIIGCLTDGRLLGLEVASDEKERKAKMDAEAWESVPVTSGSNNRYQTLYDQAQWRKRARPTGAVVAVVCSAEEAWELVSREDAWEREPQVSGSSQRMESHDTPQTPTTGAYRPRDKRFKRD